MNKLEEKIGWKKIMTLNKKLGQFIGIKPKIHWGVGNGKSYCYTPDQRYFNHPILQKNECEKFLREQKENYPDGWVTKENHRAIEIKTYPFFNENWNELMKVISFVRKQNSEFRIDTDINITYLQVCNELNCL